MNYILKCWYYSTVLKVVVKDFTNTEYFNAGLRSGLYFINTNSSKLHVQ